MANTSWELFRHHKVMLNLFVAASKSLVYRGGAAAYADVSVGFLSTTWRFFEQRIRQQYTPISLLSCLCRSSVTNLLGMRDPWFSSNLSKRPLCSCSNFAYITGMLSFCCVSRMSSMNLKRPGRNSLVHWGTSLLSRLCDLQLLNIWRCADLFALAVSTQAWEDRPWCAVCPVVTA